MTAAAHFPGVDLMDGHVPATNLNAAAPPGPGHLGGQRGYGASGQRRVGSFVRPLVGEIPDPGRPEFHDREQFGQIAPIKLFTIMVCPGGPRAGLGWAVAAR